MFDFRSRVQYRYTCSVFKAFFQETMRAYYKLFLILLCVSYFVRSGVPVCTAAPSLEIPPFQQLITEEEPAAPISLTSPVKTKAPAPVHLHVKSLRKSGGKKIEIAAVVNDEIISTTDLEDRLLLVTGGKIRSIPVGSTEYKNIQSLVLKQLIDERLQIHICKKSGLVVTEQEIDEALRNIEKQNNLAPGGLKLKLAQDKVPLQTLREKIWAQIAWNNLIGGSYRDVFRVSKMDVQDTIRKLSKKTPQYQLAEIVAFVDNPAEEETALAKMNAAFEALKARKPFIMVAQEFSEAPSAIRGGDIGWIAEDQLDEQVVELLKNTPLNNVTPIIRTEDGYQILFLRDKINFDQMEEVLTARQLEVKIPEEILKDPAKLETEKKRLEDLVKMVKNCQDFDQLADQIENSSTNIYKNVRLADLSPDLQAVLSNLMVNEPSSGILNEKTLVFFMICQKGHLHPESMTKEQTLDQISGQRFEAISQQKLRDLRRMAAIDIRV